jgi:hypothetical protein
MVRLVQRREIISMVATLTTTEMISSVMREFHLSKLLVSLIRSFSRPGFGKGSSRGRRVFRSAHRTAWSINDKSTSYVIAATTLLHPLVSYCEEPVCPEGENHKSSRGNYCEAGWLTSAFMQEMSYKASCWL